MDHRRRRAGGGDARDLRPLARQHWRRAAVGARCCWSALLLARHAAPAGWRSLLCVVWAASPLWTWWVSRPRPARRATPLSPADRAYLRRHRARHLAAVRALRRRRGQPPAARQPADRAARHGGAPHLADQHRPVPAGVGLRAPVRLDRHAGAARAPGGHAGHAGRAAAPPRPLSQLVRHADARGAAAACMCPPSTAATSAATCWRWRRPASSWPLAPHDDARAAQRAARVRRSASRRCAPAARWPPARRRRPGASAGAAGPAGRGRAPSPRGCERLLREATDELAAAAARRRSTRPPTDATRRARLVRSRDHLATLRSALRDIRAAAATPRRDGRRRRAPARRWPRAASSWPGSPTSRFLYHRKRHLFHIGYRVAEQQLDAELLRPAGLRIAADQPAGDRQGRRAGAPLGRARPAVLCRRHATPACARGRARCSST